MTEQLPVLSSTFFLTLLMFIGLFFFIRASVKARIEEMELRSDRARQDLYTGLINYFEGRAYQTIAQDLDASQVTFEGFVRPSLFLAVFLSFLAACGCFCLGLVLAYLIPAVGGWSLLFLLLAPGAGVFYWRQAGRLEQVQVKISAQASQSNLVWVQGHRDELTQLKKNFGAIGST
ncbi:MAG: cofactor assembly of complex C subunit B [Cyanobacteria bacterium P01_G01_bin.54]